MKQPHKKRCYNFCFIRSIMTNMYKHIAKVIYILLPLLYTFICKDVECKTRRYKQITKPVWFHASEGQLLQYRACWWAQRLWCRRREPGSSDRGTGRWSPRPRRRRRPATNACTPQPTENAWSWPQPELRD